MKSIRNTILASALLVFAGSANAALINFDPDGINLAGVVGTIAVTTNESSSPSNEMLFGNHLLSLGANITDSTDANGSGSDEIYNTSSTDYNGTLSLPTAADKDESEGLTGWLNYEYVMGKYNGINGGWVLFNVADYVAANGDSLPANSYPIWSNGNSVESYQLSHWTGFNGSVPEPSIIALFGLGLLGLGFALRRRTI